MIIDAHTHIGFGRMLDKPPAALAASMRKAGIDKAMVFAGRINQCPTETLLKAIAPYKGKMYAVGSLTPTAKLTPLRTVDGWLKRKQIHGLKFYPGYEYFYPFDKKIRPYLKLLIKYGRPAVFHSGDTYNMARAAKLKYAHPLHIDELAAEMPDLNIIIAHVGYPWVIDAAEVCYKNKNVYVDCSGFVYGKFTPQSLKDFKEIIRDYDRVAGTLDRVLFGTDWFIADQSSYIRAAREVFGAKNKTVFSENAKRLFGI